MQCSVCKEWKPFETDFYPSNTASGREGRCKACVKAKAASYAQRHPTTTEYRTSQSRKYRAVNQEQNRAYQAAWATERRRQNREAAFDHYGRKCACCREAEMRFLCIDHIGNNGNLHRRAMGAWANIYRWLRDHDYPEGFQTLCHNCNFAKAHGGCPHLTAPPSQP